MMPNVTLGPPLKPNAFPIVNTQSPGLSPLESPKRATDALATGRGQLKGATGTDWMRDPYVHDS